MAKPANGRYRLTATGGPDAALDVDDNGAQATWEYLTWDETNQVFVGRSSRVGIECTGSGTFSAIWDPGTPQEKTYSGTCAVEGS